MTSVLISHSCTLDRFPEPNTGLPRSICDTKPNNSFVLYTTQIGLRHRFIYPLCDEHFLSLKKELEEEWVVDPMGYLHPKAVRFRFRKNRI